MEHLHPVEVTNWAQARGQSPDSVEVSNEEVQSSAEPAILESKGGMRFEGLGFIETSSSSRDGDASLGFLEGDSDYSGI